MGKRFARRYCYNCQSMVKAEWSGCNHILHLLLSMVTFGFWIIIWCLVASSNGYKCSQCGSSARDHEPPRPRKKRTGLDVVKAAGVTAAIAVAGILVVAINRLLDGPPAGQSSPSAEPLAASTVATAVKGQSASASGPPVAKTAQQTPPPINWATSITKSKISDRTNVVLQATSNEVVKCGWSQDNRVHLLIYCDENRTSLLVNTGCFMASTVADYGNVVIRMDKQQARTYAMKESTDNKALGLWGGGSSIPVIKQIMNAQSVVVRATPYNESPFTVTFDVAGLASAIKPVRQHCGW